jgi:Fe-S cluster assembly scaffold protein SufB
VDTSAITEHHTGDHGIPSYDSLGNVPDELKETLIKTGIDQNASERAGTYIQDDEGVSFCSAEREGVEILPILEAIEKYDWLHDYYWWKAVAVDTDRYTAETALAENLQGCFIRALPGVKEIFPLQSCLFVDFPGFKQKVHNIIIAEEGSELNIITGCTLHKGIKKALHLGVSEFYAKKNSKISFTMVHHWESETEVRPRTGVILDDNAQFVSNYIVMSNVKSLQSNPKVWLRGENSQAYLQSLLYAKEDSHFDVGGTAILEGRGSSAQVVSRVIARDNAYVNSRGTIIGDAPDVVGHIECQGLLLSPTAFIASIPEIQAKNPDISVTHEAAVGRIASEQIEYLNARGLDDEEARKFIIRGFLDADTSRLPPALARETARLIEISAQAEM